MSDLYKNIQFIGNNNIKINDLIILGMIEILAQFFRY